jgi:MFS family permease
MSAWLVALLLGVSQAPTWGWTSVAALGLIAAGIVLCLVWIAVEARATSPIIDMRMMRRPTVWRLNLVSLLYGVGQYGSFVFLPEYAQSPKSTGYGYGATVTQSGLYLLPSSAMTFLFGLASAPLARRFGQKRVVLAGSSLAIVSYVILALPIHGVAVLTGASACQGAGFGLAFATMANMLVTAVPVEQTGVANGMNTNLRTIGGAIGVAATSSVITAHLQSGGYPIAAGYRDGWLVLAGCATVATVVALALPHDSRRARPRLVTTAAGSTDGPGESTLSRRQVRHAD